MKWARIYQIGNLVIIDQASEVDKYRSRGDVEFLGIVLKGDFLTDLKLIKARMRLNRDLGL